MTDVTLLNRVMYSEAEAARILGMSARTLNYWLEGKTYQGRVNDPVIRQERTGSRELTWAEFIEAGLLRQYRQADIPMKELRYFIQSLREKFGVPYPLAHERPLTLGRSLVMEAQTEAGLPPEYWLVSQVLDQQMLLPSSADFLRRVTWDADIAVAWRPTEESGSTVLCSPTRRFGRPQVAGISTEVIREHHDAEEGEADIAEQFQLSVEDVRWALAYELSARARQAA